MKVVLRKDTPNLGERDEIKEVKGGYFRNYLMPQRLAEPATPQKIKELEAKRVRREKGREEFLTKAAEELRKTGEQKLVFELPVTEEGHLYEGISASDIQKELHHLGMETIQKEWIQLENPIKRIGEYEVEIKTPEGERGMLKIEIREKNTT